MCEVETFEATHLVKLLFDIVRVSLVFTFIDGSETTKNIYLRKEEYNEWRYDDSFITMYVSENLLKILNNDIKICY